MKCEFSQQILEKFSNIIFCENPSSGSQVVPCRQTDRWMDRQTDMMNLIVAVHNFVNMPESEIVYVYESRNVGVKLTAFVMKYGTKLLLATG